MKKFAFWSQQVVPWITLVAMSMYMVYGSFQVLDKKCTVGMFVATLGAYKDLGDRFEGVHSKVQEALSTVEPLEQLVRYLNLGTDLEDRKNINRLRRQFVHDMLQDLDKSSTPDKVFWDNIRIQFDKVNIVHIPSLNSVHLKIFQDTMTLVSGPHGSGKGSLLNVFTKNFGGDGAVLFPPFLFCLQVSREPTIITYLSLFENLCYGRDFDLERPDRCKTIFKQFLLDRDGRGHNWLLDQLEVDIQNHQDGTLQQINKKDLLNEDDPHNTMWFNKLSVNEMKRIHLARALIFSPNILALHRPCDDVDTKSVDLFMKLLRDFVENRGLEVPDDEHAWELRHPRTVFLTSGKGAHRDNMEQWCDYHWSLDGGYLKFDVGSYRQGSEWENRGGNNHLSERIRQGNKRIDL
jgi:ABC-type lipoprotein export system ATPase subunit